MDDLFLSNKFPASEVGVFVGCGASKESGYPLTWELTKQVLEKLDANVLKAIEGVLKNESLILDINNGFPDIETINDLVIKTKVQTKEDILVQTEKEIYKKIHQVFESIKTHDLNLHRRFLNFVKKRSLGISSDFWVFTTNYDLLFEEAASFEKIHLENGFVGSTLRFFDIESLKYDKGETRNNRFFSHREAVVRLIKLHGSLSWHNTGSNYFEGTPVNGDKVVILPSRNKVIDTLHSPFDSLFTHANQILGSRCKYLLCFGHSFRDDHINKNLILPKLKTGTLKVMAIMKELTAEAKEMSAHNSFNFITEKKMKIDGKEHEIETDIWQFSSLLKYIEQHQV